MPIFECKNKRDSSNKEIYTITFKTIMDGKPANFKLSFVAEQHDYETRSTNMQHLNPDPFIIKIRGFGMTLPRPYANVISFGAKTVVKWSATPMIDQGPFLGFARN